MIENVSFAKVTISAHTVRNTPDSGGNLGVENYLLNCTQKKETAHAGAVKENLYEYYTR